MTLLALALWLGGLVALVLCAVRLADSIDCWALGNPAQGNDRGVATQVASNRDDDGSSQVAVGRAHTWRPTLTRSITLAKGRLTCSPPPRPHRRTQP